MAQESLRDDLRFIYEVVVIALYGNWLISLLFSFKLAPISSSIILFSEATSIALMFFTVYAYFVLRNSKKGTYMWFAHLLFIIVAQASENALNPSENIIQPIVRISTGILLWFMILVVHQVKQRYFPVEDANHEPSDSDKCGYIDEDGDVPAEDMDERLVLEYKTLNEAIWRRGSDTMILESIIIPASILVSISMLENIKIFGYPTMIPGVKLAEVIPVISIIMIGAAFLIRWTTNKLDNEYHNRIKCIAKKLKIKGPHTIHDKVDNKYWYKYMRRYSLYALYGILFIVYVMAIYWAHHHILF